MKLARIDHNRCRDISATTWVWIPDVMKESDLEKLVDAAQKSYLKAEEDLANAPDRPKPPGYGPDFEQYRNTPTITVGEMLDAYERQKKAWDDWNERANAARKSFADHLVAVSEGKIKQFYEVDVPVRVKLDWGHRHGQTIDYSDVNPTAQDLNYPEKDDF